MTKAHLFSLELEYTTSASRPHEAENGFFRRPGLLIRRLTLTAMALFSPEMSLPLVTLNLVAQVT
jgi:hypothetical protein